MNTSFINVSPNDLTWIENLRDKDFADLFMRTGPN